LQIDTDLILIITSTADKLSGVSIWMILNDLEPPNIYRGFREFFAISRCQLPHTFKSELASPKSLEIDNLRMKFSVLN